MLTDYRILLLINQMSECSESMSSNDQNQVLLKTLQSLKCKQCKCCNDEMESLARTIRHTLLEINDIQEKSRDRRHREIMALFENYFNEKTHLIPGTPANLKMEIDPRNVVMMMKLLSLQILIVSKYSFLPTVKKKNESTAWVEETTILELPIAQDAKDKLIAMHKELLDLRNQSFGIPVTKSANTKSETRNKYASLDIKVPSHPIDKDIVEVPTGDLFAIADQRKKYRDRRRKSAEGNYEPLHQYIKRSCSIVHKTTNDTSSGTTINVRTKSKEAPSVRSEGGFSKGLQEIENAGKAGQISLGSRKLLNLDAEDRGGTEITRDEFMAMRNEMFAKQRKKMQDRERKYACK
ncbi:unnamed protein product [Ceratitis capitata]|uniref:(Mediterranean fruit fly) hypothetical protein n=1 Tax=Ceratitis capitata TaxID=7213 RepID=A0A811V1J9_CERCA|nr:unnamed protein product [Ceratitis capitata]